MKKNNTELDLEPSPEAELWLRHSSLLLTGTADLLDGKTCFTQPYSPPEGHTEHQTLLKQERQPIPTADIWGASAQPSTTFI